MKTKTVLLLAACLAHWGCDGSPDAQRTKEKVDTDKVAEIARLNVLGVMRKAELLASARERAAAAKAAADPAIPAPGIHATTSKEIEVFGENMQGKPLQMLGRFCEVDSSWVKLYYDADQCVGFFMWDQNTDLFQDAVVDKGKHGRAVLGLKRGQEIRAVGWLTKIHGHVFFLVNEITFISPDEQASRGGAARTTP